MVAALLEGVRNSSWWPGGGPGGRGRRGAAPIFEENNFSVKRGTPLSTSTTAIGVDDTALHLYDTMTSRSCVYRLP